MKMKLIFATFALSLLAVLPAQAGWAPNDINTDNNGSRPQITNGVWTLTLYDKARAKYLSHEEGASTVLDLRDVNTDLAAAGSTLKVTGIDNSGFDGNTIVTEVYLPDDITELRQYAFRLCSALTKVCLSKNAYFSSTHVFSQCAALETVYYNGVDPETGTVQLPESVTEIKNYTFEQSNTSNGKIKKVVAPEATSIQEFAFQQQAELEVVEAPKATAIGKGAFFKCQSLKSASFPSATTIDQQAFRNCPVLETVEISPNFSTLVAAGDYQHFEACPKLKSIYPHGTEPEEGTLRFPATLTTMPERVFPSNNGSIRKIVAPGVTTVGNQAFAGCTALESVELSPNLVEMKANNSWQRGPFHNGESTFRSSFVHFSPSTFSSSFYTEASNYYQGTFPCTAITNYFDFSACSTIESFPEYFTYNTCIAGATFPATLTNLANKSFGRIRNAATFRFLGAPPAVSVTNGDAPFKNGQKNADNTSANEVGLRHTFVVDAANFPAWTSDAGFVSVADIKTSTNNEIKKFQDAVNNPTDSRYDFPTPDYPDETLGITSWGNQSGNYSWLVQFVDHSSFEVTWMNGETTFDTTSVEVGGAPKAPAGTPVKDSTQSEVYTFIGWNTDPNATTALELETLSINSVTTFYAIYSSSARPYTLTWSIDGAAETTTALYGEHPSHLNPSKTGYSFTGWTIDGGDGTLYANAAALPTVEGDTTYVANFVEVTGTAYTITWNNWDGSTLGTDTVADGTIPTYNGATPTKDPDVDKTYAFSGWTPTIVAANADATYTATFTASTRQYTVTFADWDGSVVSAIAYDYNTAGTAVAIPENPTRPATVEYTYTFTGWSPATVADVTGDATYTALYSETPNEYTATFVNGRTAETISSATFAYGATVTAPEPPTIEGYHFVEWSPAVGTMPAADTTYTATYAINVYTITWVNGDNTTTATVQHDATPTAPNGSKTATTKASYSFTGWTPEIEVAASNTTYTATFAANILSPMMIALSSAAYDKATAKATVVTTLGNTLDDGATTEATAEAVNGSLSVSGESTVAGATVTSEFTDFATGRGYEWTITASQTFANIDGADSASIKGRTYARSSKTWFADATFEDGTFAPGGASRKDVQVRLRATVTLPATLPRSLPDGEASAVTGIAVCQPNAGVAPLFHVWNGTAWVKLVGVYATAGSEVSLLGVVDFARKGGPAVAWYANGYQLTTETGEWEVPLAGGTQLSSFKLVGDLSASSFAADYDGAGAGIQIIVR